MSEEEQIIIVGGGPVGYTLALNLAQKNIPFTLLEADFEIFADPRAGTVHPPSLEMFAGLGLAETFIERGYIVPEYHYRDRKTGIVAAFNLSLLAADTAFPFRLMLEQHKISAIVAAKLSEYEGHQVLNGHRVVGAEDRGDHAAVTADTPDGPKSFKGRYVIGCDGGRSVVRKSMNVDFDGFTFSERFLVLTTPHDFSADGFALTNYVADPEEWCAVFKVPGPDDKGIWRVLFPTEEDDREEDIFDDAAIEARLQGFNPKPRPYQVRHRNLYEVHQRVASSYRDGRLLLAGDAAHINNPLGGMGMNFGFHDAFNLAEKLAAIWAGDGGEELIDLYDRQRRTVAADYLQRQTIENKKNIELKAPEERQKFYDELRAIVSDDEVQHQYLRRVAMIEGIERSRSIT